MDSDFGPSLPTYENLRNSTSFIQRRIREMEVNELSNFIKHVRHGQHLDTGLADPHPSQHDLYLVTCYEGVWGSLAGVRFIGSAEHWSVFCNGHFYHLSAPGLPRQFAKKCQQTAASKVTENTLKHEDLSSEDTEDYKRVVSSNAYKSRALMAYKIGQTDYSQVQILQLAESIIAQLPDYGLFTANCQHFARSLVTKTLMRLADRSVFEGTATQIADWDRNGQPTIHVNSRKHGFIIQPPLPIRTTYLQERWISLRKRFQLMNPNNPNSSTVRHSYYYGVRDIFPGNLTYHPKCYWKYKGGPCLSNVKEALMHGQWKDFIYGTCEEQPDGSIQMSSVRPTHSILGCHYH